MPLLFILLLWAVAAPAQPQYFTAFNIEDGLRQSQVYALCEDHRGYLWVGTQGGGVGRFDGVQITHFTTSEGLPSNFVNAIYEDHQHRIWMGTSQGLCFFDGKKITASSTRNYISSIVETPDHRLLTGTQRGIWQYNMDQNACEKANIHPTLNELTIYALLPPHNGDIWVGTERGIWQFNERNRANDVSKQLHLPQFPAYALTRHQNTIWFSSLGAGLIGITGQQTRTVRQPAIERVISLAADQDGTLWAGTVADGIYHLSPDSLLQHFTEADGLPHNSVRALLTDHNNRLWVGTSGGGFAFRSTRAFRAYNRADGLPGTRIYALSEDPRGRIWMAVSQQGLAVLDSFGLRAAQPDSGYLQGVKCRTLAHDRNGTLWVGTEGKGVLAISPNGLQSFTQANGFLPSDWVQKVVCTPDDAVWIGTSEGLVQLTPRPEGGFAARRYGMRDGMPGSSVTALQLDPLGNLWFGTFSGAAGYLKNGRVEANFGSEQGLSGTITAIAFGPKNQCYIATKGRGIFQGTVRPGTVFTRFRYSEKNSSDNIYLLAVDAAGDLWAGTENGVDRISFDKGAVSAVAHFGQKEGFSGIETCQDAFLMDSRGGTWFGTMNGLMRYTPVAVVQQSSAPVLHFEKAHLFYKPLEETAFKDQAARLFDATGLLLPWNQNHLSFLVKGIDLTQKNATMLYRYQLEGADTGWSPWSPQMQVNYANLAAGQYHLLVQASTDEVNVSNTVHAWFTISKPFWKKWPFIALVVALALGLLAWGVRVYIRGVRRSEAEQREKLQVQNHILQLEQKALQLQMNPHFIFNALNSIQSLIATQDYTTARTEINHFAKLMRSILHNSRQQLITLREETDTLEQYLKIEQFCQQNPFTFEITHNTPDDLENIEIPPMLLQPFVENAVIHGIAPLKTPGHIQVHFELTDETLTCNIRDNGVGREKAALLKAAKKPGHQSAAMQVTHDRLAAMGGSVHFYDVETGGTEVVVQVGVGF